VVQEGMKEQVQDMNSGDGRQVTLLNLIFEPNSHQFTLNLSKSLIRAIVMRILGNSGIKKV
jgi:hypothetical protein